MNTVKDGYEVIKSLRPAPVDQTNVLEDRILDLLFDGSRYVQENHKAVGFISHMDTAPDYSGKDIKPQIIPDYDGNDVLLKGSGTYLKVSDFPTLKTLKGRTLITTDGTTLLGADDKAGVSEIMTAVEQIITEKIPHGDIWIGFTPDEEVGSGADLFDLDYFKARFAYTVDGDYEGLAPVAAPVIEDAYQSMTIEFGTVVGKTYRVESSDTVDFASVEVAVDNIAGTGDYVRVSDLAKMGSAKFYRVVLED